MERNKQIQVGLLVLLALLLVANVFFKDGLKGLFSQSEASRIRQSAAASSLSSNADGSLTAMPPIDGNIPGTNINSQVSNMPPTTIQYDGDKFNFGVINEGEVVTHVFKFKNTGSEPLLISNAKGSCGCTVPT